MAKKAKKIKIEKARTVITADDVRNFRAHFKLTQEELALLLGVTWQAVDHWECARRLVPETTVRLFKLFYKYPQLVNEF